MDEKRVYNVLFLCTHNSARSIMAEAIVNAVGGGRLNGYSAGSHPASNPHPMALATLQNLHLPTEGLRSKAWDEFAGPDAPRLDFVFTVCDDAAGEVCPVWPGQPITAHWGVEDPSRFEGTEAARRDKFLRVAMILRHRIELFASLPLAKLDHAALKARLEDIGRR